MERRRLVRAGLILALLLGGLNPRAVGIELAIDRVMYLDPPIDVPPDTQRIDAGIVPLWRRGIAEGEAEMRRLAIDSVAIARQRGMEGLDVVAADLVPVLQSDPDPLVRRAAARTLVVLDARDAAEALAAAIRRDGPRLAVFVEPALAGWDHAPMRPVWLERLETLVGPRNVETDRAVALATIEALGTVREPRAVDGLRTIVLDPEADVERRSAAARALGSIRDDGLVETAAAIAATPTRPPELGRVLAVHLLARQTGDVAVDLLRRLAGDDQPAVARAALARLDAVDAAAALAVARESLGNPDAGVRTLAARLVLRQENDDAVRLCGPLLDDRNPTLRREVAGRLADFGSRPPLLPTVIEVTTAVLAQESWRGCEQAALVLGHLDHEPSVPRLMELLDHPRGEAAVSASWALRKLEVVDTLAPLLERSTRLGDAMQSQPQPPALSQQVSQFFQLFGRLDYRPAEPLMRRFIPKSPVDHDVRSAACWSLGLFHADEPDDELAAALAERLADSASIPPESLYVRWACAISLGRMHAEQHLDTLRNVRSTEGLRSVTGLASAWAIEVLTGEVSTPPPPAVIGVGNWFLQRR